MQDPVAAPSPMRAYKRMGDEEEGKSFNDDMAEAEAMEVVAPEAPPQELPAQEALDAFEEANPEARAILVPSCVVTAIGFALLGSQMLQLAGLYVVPGESPSPPPAHSAHTNVIQPVLKRRWPMEQASLA